ncbi:tRNA 4-thiouridine(8) synthase ThiI [Candidatus Bathyarchaeota archaeon]|nr:tRNA 4-thiouridine(8) synthase ThiI [Candidatus Bathyarchaeota archaeon]
MPILVAYNEIALKSRYVRSSLEKKLVTQIGYKLKSSGYSNFEIARSFGRIIVTGVPNEAAEIIAKIFGVVYCIPSEVTDTKIDSIVSKAVEVAGIVIKEGSSFAVRPKVIGEQSYHSRDLAIKTGAAILEAYNVKRIRVNLTEPDVTVGIEVRDSSAYIYTKTVQGVSGLPYGSQGTAVALFSGGIDSPVAAWLMMKRGVAVYSLFMDQTPYVGDSYISRAKEAFNQIRSFAPTDNFTLSIAPMGEIMTRITELREPRFTCILCKRAMYVVAEAFSVKVKAKGVITGESLGQVASQTLDNLYVLDSAVNLPIFRPLIGLDKVEIEDYARIIGTYSLTAKKVEGCKVTPSSPATTSKLDKIVELEQELDLKKLCFEAAEKVYSLKIC